MLDINDPITRVVTNLAGRLSGPFNLRFWLQPCMAAFFAIRDGRRDAQEGRPAYFWTIFVSANRRERLKSGWKSIGKVFLIALALDAVYQIMELRWFYPGEALMVACLLALLPYLLIRGPINRILSRRRKPSEPIKKAA